MSEEPKTSIPNRTAAQQAGQFCGDIISAAIVNALRTNCPDLLQQCVRHQAAEIGRLRGFIARMDSIDRKFIRRIWLQFASVVLAGVMVGWGLRGLIYG